MTGSEGLIISAAGVIVGMTVRELPRIVLEKVLLRRQPKSAEPPLYVNGNGKRLELRGDGHGLGDDVHVHPRHVHVVAPWRREADQGR